MFAMFLSYVSKVNIAGKTPRMIHWVRSSWIPAPKNHLKLSVVHIVISGRSISIYTLVRTFSFNHIGSLIHFKRIFCFINWIVKKNNRLKNFLKRNSSIQPSATGIKFLQKLFPQLDNFISPKIKSYVVFSWSYVIFIGQSTKMSEN